MTERIEMYELSNNDPLLRQHARYVGKALTIGNLAALDSSIAETRAALVRLEASTNADLAKLEVKLNADLSDLSRQVDEVIVSTSAAIAAADERDRLARGPRR